MMRASDVDDQREAEAEGVDGWEQEAYLAQYQAFSLHRELLSDRRRNDAYRAAIASACANKVVLDVGAGTGLLSFMAAKADALRVYSCESSDMAWHAYQNAHRNGLADRVHVTQSRVEELTLPEKVDVLLSEWMGSFLFFEGMLESVLIARDKHLREGGVMIPNSCRLFACPVDLTELLADMVGWWNDVEGFDMSHMAQVLLQELRKRPIHQRPIDASAVAGVAQTVCDFDLATLCVADLERIRSGAMRWPIEERRSVHAMCLHFSVGFPDNKTRATAPTLPATHWNQELLLFDEPLAMEAGDAIECTVTLERNSYWRRHYAIAIDGRHVDKDGNTRLSFSKTFPHHRHPTTSTTQ